MVHVSTHSEIDDWWSNFSQELPVFRKEVLSMKDRSGALSKILALRGYLAETILYNPELGAHDDLQSLFSLSGKIAKKIDFLTQPLLRGVLGMNVHEESKKSMFRTEMWEYERGLDDYIRIFGRAFELAYYSLTSDAHLIDFGSGGGGIVSEDIRSTFLQSIAFMYGFYDCALNKPETTSDVSMDKLDSMPMHTLISLHSPIPFQCEILQRFSSKINAHFGVDIGEINFDEIPKTNLGVDCYGPFTYSSMCKKTLLMRYLSLLSHDGLLFIHSFKSDLNKFILSITGERVSDEDFELALTSIIRVELNRDFIVEYDRFAATLFFEAL